MNLNPLFWFLGVFISVLTAINVVCWGYVIKEVGEPQLTINFFFKLVFNKFFILAMLTAFSASLISYAVLKEMGILVGRFFLSMGSIVTVLICTFILKEQIQSIQWIGVVLVLIGIILLGKG